MNTPILQMRRLRQPEVTNNFPQVTQPELKSRLTGMPTHLTALCYPQSPLASHLLQEVSPGPLSGCLQCPVPPPSEHTSYRALTVWLGSEAA